MHHHHDSPSSPALPSKAHIPPVATPKKKTSSRSVPPMPASASPVPGSLRGWRPQSLHPALQQTPAYSPTHAVPHHSKSCSSSPAIPSEPPTLPSPFETQNF